MLMALPHWSRYGSGASINCLVAATAARGRGALFPSVSYSWNSEVRENPPFLEPRHYYVAWRYRKTVTQLKVKGSVISCSTARRNPGLT